MGVGDSAGTPRGGDEAWPGLVTPANGHSSHAAQHHAETLTRQPPTANPQPLSRFLSLRDSLLSRRIGDGGPDVCRALTETLDGCIDALYAPLAGERLAAVAVGGYGRAELCLYSDIDVMLLHGGRLPARTVESVLYPLWDARLKVGHAVRSIKDALAAACERLETLTALLDARLIAGDQRLVDELLAGLGDLLRRHRAELTAPLLAAERARREREPFQLQEADLKDGRGGLRTLHTLHWERRRLALTGAADPAPPSPVERAAHAGILATRNALHAAAGRPFDSYAYDLRPAVAAWLGLDPDAAGSRLYMAMRTVDRLAAERWEELTSPPSPPLKGRGASSLAISARLGSDSLPGRLSSHAAVPERQAPLSSGPPRGPTGPIGVRPQGGGTPGQPRRDPADLSRGLGGRSGRGWAGLLPLRRRAPASATLSPQSSVLSPSSSSPLAIAVQALRRPAGGRAFTEEEAAIIRSAGGPAWDSTDRTALLQVLKGGYRGWEVFSALEDLGWVGRALPEWRHAVAAPQHAPFHLHPLDVHLWRTVLELQTIARPDGGEPWCDEVAADLGSLDDALLAAFLHDIGKGWPGDHSIAGAQAVAAFCRRARFGPAMVGTVTGAVRHHLLLPNVATRRDIDDSRVIVQVADQAGDVRSLRILYLLSVADSRATGPTVWTPWKASLVRSLFARAADELVRRASAAEHSPIEDRIRRELEEATAGRFDPVQVRDHLDAMPASYLTSFTIEDLVRHLEAVLPPPEPGTVIVGVRAMTSVSNVIVVAEDRPGLLAAMSGVFALHNVSVLDGRFFTRADGLVVDSFHVEDALGGQIDEARWSRVRADMARAIHGELPLEELLREKAHAYRRGAGARAPVRVLVDTGASESFTVVEVHCTDRVGILHDIARALFELGLDIRLAKIDTQGREVIDTFYVRDLDGEPVRDRAGLAAIERGVKERLEAGFG